MPVTFGAGNNATPPAGTDIETSDDPGNGARQVVEVAAGGGGVAKSRIQVSSAGLTTATTAYSANDQLGTILTFASAVSASGGIGTVIGATLLDKAAIVGAISLYLFDRSVTLAVDNAQAAFSDADMMFCVGIVEFPPLTLSNVAAANGLAQIEPIALPYECNATSLFGAMVTRTGHTFFGAVTDLVVSLTVETS